VLLAAYQAPSLSVDEDRRPLLDRIAQAADRAVALDPGCDTALRALGSAHLLRDRDERSRGQELPWLHLVIDEVARTLAGDPMIP
jgi:hypothetical protein